jgi:hypothetical protein
MSSEEQRQRNEQKIVQRAYLWHERYKAMRTAKKGGDENLIEKTEGEYRAAMHDLREVIEISLRRKES